MSRELDLSKQLVDMFNDIRFTWRQNAIILGGTSGSGGGSGGPAGGYIGQAPQTKIAGDTSELRVLTSGSIGSLLDNLNNIRYWETVQIAASAPPTTFAGQLWVDTSSGSILMVRNSSDTAWMTVSSSGSGVTSIQADANPALTGAVTLASGTNISLGQSGNTITINNTLGAGGVEFDPAFPLPVSASAVVGTSGSPPHANHVHVGVSGLYTGTNSAQAGVVDLVAGSGLTITQSSGSFTWATSGSFVPVVHDINGAYHNGFPLTVANGGTGVTTTPTSGALLIGTNSGGYAVNNLTAGANITITNSSGSVTIASTASGGVPLTANAPQDVGGAAVVGSSGSASDGAHVHRGVHSASIAGGSFAYGDIQFEAGTNISLSQSSGSITINNTLGAGGIEFDPANPQDVGESANVGSSGSAPHADHVHRGVTSVSQQPSGSYAYGNIALIAGSNVTITQSSGSFTVASTGGGGLGSGYILIEHREASNTAGGTLTSGAWRTRKLTDEVFDTGNNVSIASNQMTLGAGTYRISVWATTYNTLRNQLRLYNISDSAVVLVGMSSYTGAQTTPTFLTGRFTLAAQKVLEIQHQCQQTGTTQGMGVEVGSSFAVDHETYLSAELIRE